MKFRESIVETDGLNTQHAGVMNAFASAILHGTPLVAEGVEGINGLSISNAMHLSAWLDTTVNLSEMDHEQYYEELMKRVSVSRRKTTVNETVVCEMGDTFGS